MQSTAARLGVVVAVIAAAVVLFIVLDSGSDDDSGDGNTGTGSTSAGTTTTAGPTVINVRDGEPVGGVQQFTYGKGEQVNLEIRLNRPEEEIHVHGYELEEPAEHSPVRLSFPAKLDGIFEIEVHSTDGTEAEIAELRVNP
jgi:hypothetical protein